jgi:hypothetical protein
MKLEIFDMLKHLFYFVLEIWWGGVATHKERIIEA